MAVIIAVCGECEGRNRIPDVKQHLKVRCGKCKELLDVEPYAISVILSDNDMDAFIKSCELPVMVDFFSPACGPCRTLAPFLEKMAREFFGRLIVAKVDTTRNPGCAAYYKITGVPTLIFFQGGKRVDQIVGLPELGHLQAKLRYYAG